MLSFKYGLRCWFEVRADDDAGSGEEDGAAEFRGGAMTVVFEGLACGGGRSGSSPDAK